MSIVEPVVKKMKILEHHQGALKRGWNAYNFPLMLLTSQGRPKFISTFHLHMNTLRVSDYFIFWRTGSTTGPLQVFVLVSEMNRPFEKTKIYVTLNRPQVIGPKFYTIIIYFFNTFIQYTYSRTSKVFQWYWWIQVEVNIVNHSL